MTLLSRNTGVWAAARGIARAVILLGILVGVWLGLAAASMLPGSISTALIPAATPLPKAVSVIDRRGPFLVVHSEDPTFVRSLYANGAAFVLPARKKTCLNWQS